MHDSFTYEQVEEMMRGIAQTGELREESFDRRDIERGQAMGPAGSRNANIRADGADRRTF
jgi:hypothetical protein